MKRAGRLALLALCLGPAACSSGFHPDFHPLATSQKSDRIQDLSMAIARSPQDVDLYAKRAEAYENIGDYKSAIDDLNKAISLKPGEAQYRFLRAIAFAYAGDDAMAKQEFATANAMDPNSADGYDAEAWVLATAPEPSMRNGAKAIEYATKACQMTDGKDPDKLETLAAAYAESGNFDEAIKWQNKAIDLTSPTLLPTLNDRRTRLEFYRKHQPWRPTPPNQTAAAS
jgi:tetratricopeptide (TPR) repeat protein